MSELSNGLRQALANALVAMGDDELILAQRDSAWCGHAPILEEDIAFANIALDELGHARTWYGLAAGLLGEDEESYPDELAFGRDAEAFRCVQMVELPKGDWAFTITRQYLFDSFEVARLEGLQQSNYRPLADAAAAIRKEEIYHLRHTSAWVRRLGLGTEESHRRMREAVEALWGYARQLTAPLPEEEVLVEAGLIPSAGSMQTAWRAQVGALLAEAGLALPEGEAGLTLTRTAHSEYLADLLAEMQQVARLAPEATW